MKMIIVAVFATLSVVGSGCSGNVPGSRGVHSTSWSISSADEADLPGITSAEVATATYDDGPLVVIWSATGGGGMANHIDRKTGNLVYSSTRTTASGTEFQITCSTPDGTSGQVDIADETFDLANGKLFLVVAPEDKVLVRQLKMLPPGEPSDSEERTADRQVDRLREFAKATPEVYEFFADAVADSGTDRSQGNAEAP